MLLVWDDAKFLNRITEQRSGVSSNFQKPRPFLYTTTDEEGAMFPDYERVVAEWVGGTDHKAYVDLMRCVRSNRGHS